MEQDYINWSYNEFLAFVMIYAAEMNDKLTTEELAFIKVKTGIDDIDKIKAHVDTTSDADSIDLIHQYKKKYLAVDSSVKARRDLEALLNTGGKHSQLEKAAVHIIEKLF